MAQFVTVHVFNGRIGTFRAVKGHKTKPTRTATDLVDKYTAGNDGTVRREQIVQLTVGAPIGDVETKQIGAVGALVVGTHLNGRSGSLVEGHALAVRRGQAGVGLPFQFRTDGIPVRSHAGRRVGGAGRRWVQGWVAQTLAGAVAVATVHPTVASIATGVVFVVVVIVPGRT